MARNATISGHGIRMTSTIDVHNELRKSPSVMATRCSRSLELVIPTSLDQQPPLNVHGDGVDGAEQKQQHEQQQYEGGGTLDLETPVVASAAAAVCQHIVEVSGAGGGDRDENGNGNGDGIGDDQ